MTLLDALAEVVNSQQLKSIRSSRDGEQARLVHFAFDDKGGIAFLSELEVEELVPLLEDWCKARRVEMGRVQ